MLRGGPAVGNEVLRFSIDCDLSLVGNESKEIRLIAPDRHAMYDDLDYKVVVHSCSFVPTKYPLDLNVEMNNDLVYPVFTKYRLSVWVTSNGYKLLSNITQIKVVELASNSIGGIVQLGSPREFHIRGCDTVTSLVIKVSIQMYTEPYSPPLDYIVVLDGHDRHNLYVDPRQLAVLPEVELTVGTVIENSPFDIDTPGRNVFVARLMQF